MCVYVRVCVCVCADRETNYTVVATLQHWYKFNFSRYVQVYTQCVQCTSAVGWSDAILPCQSNPPPCYVQRGSEEWSFVLTERLLVRLTVHSLLPGLCVVPGSMREEPMVVLNSQASLDTIRD